MLEIFGVIFKFAPQNWTC